MHSAAARITLSSALAVVLAFAAAPAASGAATVDATATATSPSAITVLGSVDGLRTRTLAGVRLDEQLSGRRWKARTKTIRLNDGAFSLSFTSPKVRPSYRVRVSVMRRGRVLRRSKVLTVSYTPTSLPTAESLPGTTPARLPTPSPVPTKIVGPVATPTPKPKPTPAPTPTPKSELKVNEALGTGKTLRSPNGQYELAMQGDGNLVVYRTGGSALWSTSTSGANASLQLQADGNLVVYNAGGAATWSSRTAGHGPTRLVMQDDGNLVLYRGDFGVWDRTSGLIGHRLTAGVTLPPGYELISPNGQLHLVMQGDGNLVLYRGGRALWSTGTAGNPGARLIMQGDGNLVVYLGSTPKWASSSARGGNTLVVQDDENVVIYGPSGPTWSRGTGPISGGGTPSGGGAINDGYPYKGYAGPGTNPSTYTWTDAGGGEYSPFGYAYRNCTDFAAWYLSTRGVPNLRGLGNANTWGTVARARGYGVDRNPTPGSIAWSIAGTFGHVAVVESVSGGNVTVAEYNFANRGGFGKRTVAASSFAGFIHFF